MSTIQRHVADHAARNPDAPAILATGSEPLSYAGLCDRISSIAARLRQLQITSQDRVAVVLPEGANGAVAILGIAATAACVPLNPAYSTREFERLLILARTTALIVEAGTRSPAVDAARSLDIPVMNLETGPGTGLGSFSLTRETIPSGEAAATGEAAKDALVLLTSGSSAEPKAIALTHDNLCFSASSIASVLELSSADRALGTMPLYHIHGLSILFATLLSGGSYVGMADFATKAFYMALDEFRPSWYSASPTIHRAVLDNIAGWRGDPRDTGLRLIRSASAKAPPALIARVEGAFGVPFIEAYGMTEAAPQIASNRPPPFVRKPGSVGMAAGPEIAIVDQAGLRLPADTVGEIIIRGRNVALAGDDGWFRTGDLGHQDSDGYLFVTGRLTDVINRGGEKISPVTIEHVLLEHPAVTDAAVFGVPHAILGEDVAAAVVVTPHGVHGDAIEEIRSFAAARLARFEVPQRILIVDDIPFGPNGKVNRKDLARAFDAVALATRRHSPQPTTPMERRLAALFSEVLNTDPPGRDDDFFDLGGHSLAAMQLMARIEENFGIGLPIETIFDHRTIALLAERIGAHIADLVADGQVRLAPVRRDEAGSDADRITPRPGAQEAPLSFAQQRVYFLDRMGAGSAYNMSLSLRLSGPLDEQALALALDELRRRHDILRSTYHYQAGDLVQRVAPFRPTTLAVTDIDESEASDLAAIEADRPFDLAVGPLCRASLLRVAREDHRLLLTMHHMICDGWSVGVVHDELRALYDAFAGGRASPLPEPALQYGDFAAWQRSRATGANWRREIGRMTRLLDGLAPECTLPADRPRPAAQSYRGAIQRSVIDQPLLDQVKALALAQEATPFMALLAAFKTLLHRHNGQDRAVVGVPIANRTPRQLEPLIGFFANTLVLVSDCGGDPCFTEMLERVRATALHGFAHLETPIEQIVEQLNIPRDAGRPPLFQIMFAYQNMPGTEPGPAEHVADSAFEFAPGLTAQPMRVGRTTAKFDLTLYLAETQDGMSATWQYSTDLFDAATIETIARHFDTLLRSIVADPSQRLSQLRLMPDEERQRIERNWARTDTAPAGDSDFVTRLEAQAARSPDAPAVCDAGSRLSYAQLNQRANRYARYFRAIGIGEQTLVGICLPRSAELVAILIGIWKAGAAFLPLDPQSPLARNRFMLEDAAAMHLIVEGEDTALSDGTRLSVLRLEDCAQDVARHDNTDLGLATAPDATAYVIYTSGSTGKPKGVTIERSNIGHYAQALTATLGLRPGDRYLHAASFAVSSSIRQFVAPLAAGASVHVAAEDELRDPAQLFATIRAQHISVLDFVPSFSGTCLRVMRAMDATARADLLDNDVRLMLSASEPLPAALIAGWRALWRADLAFINMYGQTETSGIVLTYQVPVDGEPSVVMPIGRPIANTQAYVLDATLALVPVGMTGELYIGGAGVGRGYHNQPEQTAHAFQPNPFAKDGARRIYRTGDLARYRPDGTIAIEGRADAQLKVRGYRVEPVEIETAIEDAPDVRECIVCPLAR